MLDIGLPTSVPNLLINLRFTQNSDLNDLTTIALAFAELFLSNKMQHFF